MEKSGAAVVVELSWPRYCQKKRRRRRQREQDEQEQDGQGTGASENIAERQGAATNLLTAEALEESNEGSTATNNRAVSVSESEKIPRQPSLKPRQSVWMTRLSSPTSPGALVPAADAHLRLHLRAFLQLSIDRTRPTAGKNRRTSSRLMII
jgi:hypothetical protein